MRRAVVAAITSLLLIVGSTAAAVSAETSPPSPGAPGIGDPYFPKDGNGGYDVDHYSIKVAYHPASDALRGQATIRARSLQALSRFDLDFVGLTVDAGRVDGSALRGAAPSTSSR